MKKRIITILLTAVIVVSAFALMACGGLSGTEIAKEDYEKASVNFFDAFSKGSVTMDVTSFAKSDYEETSTVTTEDGDGTSKTEETEKKSTEVSSTTKMIIDGTKAYSVNEITIKSSESSSAKYTDTTNGSGITGDGSSNEKAEDSSSSKTKIEQYYEIVEDYMYTIVKDSKGKWVTKSKLLAIGLGLKEMLSISITYTSGLSRLAENFDDYEFKGGRYNVKQSVIDEERKENEEEDTNTTKYTYKYNKDDRYVVFNKDKLYSGCVIDQDTKTTVDYTYESSETKSDATVKESTTTKTVTSSIASTTAEVTYGKDIVEIPSYTK